jgi:hypothetical protein
MSETSSPGPDDANVVALGAEFQAAAPAEPPAGRPSTSRLHGLAIAGMALSALVGIGSMLAFITVGWSGRAAHFVIGVIVLSTVGFLTCASAAVFTAARDTYAKVEK